MTARWLLRQVGALLVVALCATACAADPPKRTGSSATSTTSIPSGTTTAQSGSGPSPRPPINRPLSASPYFNETMICDLFTDAQAAQLGFDGHRFPTKSESSASCNRETAAGRKPTVILRTTYYPGDFLQGVYNGQYAEPDEFQPTVIVGQPAAIFSRTGNQMGCSVAIGISDEQGVEVEIFASDDAVQRCDLAVSIAETIVHNLGG